MDTNPVSWDVNAVNCYSNCDHSKTMPVHNIVISDPLWLVIRAMLKRYPVVEWQMLLSGEIVEGEGCVCTGYYVTKQEVSAALVKHKDEITIEDIERNKFVAGIHSHVNMACVASYTDIQDSIMSPIPYHIIVNNRLELAGYRKATLPCGGLMSVGCGVKTQGEVDLSAVEIVGLERITESYPHYAGFNGHGHNPHGYGGLSPQWREDKGLLLHDAKRSKRQKQYEKELAEYEKQFSEDYGFAGGD